MREKLRRGLGLESTWLYDGEGNAPEPELWKMWSGQTARAVAEGPAKYHGTAVDRERAKPAARKKKGRER